MAILSDVLARRVIPAVLVLVLAFAPAAMSLCEVMCAAPAMAAARALTHSCHEPESATTTATVLVSVPHECGHAETLPVMASGTPQLELQPPAVITAEFSLAYIPSLIPTRTLSTSARESVPIALTLPLRV